MQENQEIAKVYGPDQTNDGEQIFWSVGLSCERIERREEYRGTYAIVWFDVFKDGKRIASMNDQFIMGVEYA